MNLSNVLRIVFSFLLFTICLSSSTPADDRTAVDRLKASKLLLNLIDQTNTIDANVIEAKIDNQTSASNDSQSRQTDDQLLSSIKKRIDTPSTDEQLVKLNTLDGDKVTKACNETTDYKCRTGECMDKSLLCDGFKDCPLGDDEENCNQNCSEHNKFQCKSDGKCIGEWNALFSNLSSDA